MIKQNIIKLGQNEQEEEGGPEVFHNLKDVRRELKLEQQRRREEEEDEILSSKMRTEPPPEEAAAFSDHKGTRVNQSEPSQLPSPRLDDDPENPLRKGKTQGELNDMKRYMEEGL